MLIHAMFNSFCSLHNAYPVAGGFFLYLLSFLFVFAIASIKCGLIWQQFLFATWFSTFDEVREFLI